MYRIILIISLVLLGGKSQAQDTPVSIPPSLSKRIELIGMTYTPTEKYVVTPSDNSFGEYACEDESCPIRKTKVMNAKMNHTDGQCMVSISAIGAERIRYGNAKENRHIKKEHPASYNRIKHDIMRWPYAGGATKQDDRDLEMILTYYPADSAKAYFNADYMACYPYYMEGKKCKDGFTCGRTIVTGKGGVDIFLYFYLTEDSADDFDKYLADFKRTLWFEE